MECAVQKVTGNEWPYPHWYLVDLESTRIFLLIIFLKELRIWPLGNLPPLSNYNTAVLSIVPKPLAPADVFLTAVACR